MIIVVVVVGVIMIVSHNVQYLQLRTIAFELMMKLSALRGQLQLSDLVVVVMLIVYVQ